MEERLLVLRYDLDEDRHADVVTLDVSSKPFRVVEALQGLPKGEFVDASERWRGRQIESDLEDVLFAYLECSVTGAAETELDAIVRGQPVRVSVIE